MKTTLYAIKKNTVIGNIMNSTAAIVLVSLLLFRRVNGQSSILIIEFEILLLVDSSTKAKLLEARCTMQTPVLTTIFNSKEP